MLAALRRLNEIGVSTARTYVAHAERRFASSPFPFQREGSKAGRRLKTTSSEQTTGGAKEAKTNLSSGTSGDTSAGAKSVFEGVDVSAGSTAAAGAAVEGGAAAGKGSTGYFGGAIMGLLTGVGAAGYIFTSEDVNKYVSKHEKSIPGIVADAALAYADWRGGMEENVKQFSEPSSEKLLPDLPPPAAQYMRTLVLDLDETLVHSDWRRERGWRTFKRPGVDEFLQHMSQFYEIVVYTGQLSTYGDPIMERLDPNRFVPYRLYRDATLYKDGKHYRDLKRLNRDLKRVLYVSSDVKNCTSEENAIAIKPWKMESNDTTLLDLMPFLEMIVRSQLPDVRQVVDSYRGTDIPSEFRARTAEMKKNLRQKSSQPRLFSGPR